MERDARDSQGHGAPPADGERPRLSDDEEVTAVAVPRPRRTFPPVSKLPVNATPLDLARAYADSVFAMSQRLEYVEQDLELAKAAEVVRERRVTELEAQVAELAKRTP